MRAGSGAGTRHVRSARLSGSAGRGVTSSHTGNAAITTAADTAAIAAAVDPRTALAVGLKVDVDALPELMHGFYEPTGFRPTAAGLVWLDDLRRGAPPSGLRQSDPHQNRPTTG